MSFLFVLTRPLRSFSRYLRQVHAVFQYAEKKKAAFDPNLRRQVEQGLERAESFSAAEPRAHGYVDQDDQKEGAA